jgi:uncharacterized integral membrane protein
MSDPQAKKTTVSVTSDSGFSMSPRVLIAIIIAVLALVFIFSNTGTATLSFVGLQFTAPGWIMFMVILLSGFLIGFMMGRNRYKRAKA